MFRLLRLCVAVTLFLLYRKSLRNRVPPQDNLTSHEWSLSFSYCFRNSPQVSEDCFFPMSPQRSSCNSCILDLDSQHLHRDVKVMISQAANALLRGICCSLLVTLCVWVLHCFSPYQQSASPALFSSFVTIWGKIVTLSNTVHTLTRTHMQNLYTHTHTHTHTHTIDIFRIKVIAHWVRNFRT